MKNLLLVVAALSTLSACGQPPSTPAPAPEPSQLLVPQEGFPPDRWAQIAAYNAALKSAPGAGPLTPGAVVAVAKRWAAGSVIHVAIRGGSPQLHRGLERVAAVWAQYANLGFDFGYNSSTNQYRWWSPTDTQRSAEIRISFDQPGYWSCVGTDSTLDACANAGQSSMNLQRFDQALPANWVSTTLHEFGHALGLEHEHQNPADGCEKEFVWQNEAGYERTTDPWGQFIPDRAGHRPGLYTVLGGPLNNWDTATIDRNMKQLPNSSAYNSSAFDKDSIMKYEFPEWQYIDRRNSKCYSERNDTLSSIDRVEIARAYPRELVLIREVTQSQISALSAVAAVRALGASTQRAIQEQLTRMKSAPVMQVK